eukprot:gene7982-8805_t
MENLCSSIAQLIHFSNEILQDHLSRTVQHDIHGSEEEAIAFSEKIILLISDLSKTSIQANKLQQKLEQREKRTVECLLHLQDLVRSQQKELQRLSQKPVTVDCASETVAVVDMEKEKLLEEVSQLRAEMKALRRERDEQVQALESANDSLTGRLKRCVLLLKAQQALIDQKKHDEEKHPEPSFARPPRPLPTALIHRQYDNTNGDDDDGGGGGYDEREKWHIDFEDSTAGLSKHHVPTPSSRHRYAPVSLPPVPSLPSTLSTTEREQQKPPVQEVVDLEDYSTHSSLALTVSSMKLGSMHNQEGQREELLQSPQVVDNIVTEKEEDMGDEEEEPSYDDDSLVGESFEGHESYEGYEIDTEKGGEQVVEEGVVWGKRHREENSIGSTEDSFELVQGYYDIG